MRAVAPHHWSYAVFKSRHVRGPGLLVVFALALAFFLRVLRFSAASKSSISKFQFDWEHTNTCKRFLQSLFVFHGYSTHIYIYISKICILFCSSADRQHRQELKATWSRLNRQSGGTMIPGAGPVTRNSVSKHTSVAWKILNDKIEWKRWGVFRYRSEYQCLIIYHVNVIQLKNIPYVKTC